MVESVAAPRRDLHLIRLYYFISIGAGGFLLPFLGLFFRRQGLSGTEIGVLGTVEAGVALLAAPVWGRWNDRLNRPRFLLQIALWGMAIASLLLGRQDQFLLIALFVALSALVSAGWMPLSDNFAGGIAERFENVGFGSIRLWGSMGWMIVAPVAGRLIEVVGIYVAFVGQATGMIASALAIRLIPEPAPEPAVSGTQAAATPRYREVLSIIRHNRRLASLVIGLACVWLLSGGLYNFEAIYLDELGASETAIGLANVLNAGIELPAMLLADRMLRRYSAGWLLRGSFLVQAVRMALILLVPTIPMIMGTRLLMGIHFSLYSVGVLAYIRSYTGASYRVTTLALITVTLRYLSTMFGNPLSGLVFDTVGAYWLYALGLVGALGGWLALWLGRHEPVESQSV